MIWTKRMLHVRAFHQMHAAGAMTVAMTMYCYSWGGCHHNSDSSAVQAPEVKAGMCQQLLQSTRCQTSHKPSNVSCHYAIEGHMHAAAGGTARVMQGLPEVALSYPRDSCLNCNARKARLGRVRGPLCISNSSGSSAA
jgi:hypothetical protein